MISKALNKMKSGKAAGPSGITAEMLKATGEEGLEQMRKLFQLVIDGKGIPEDWQQSYIKNLYKGKGDAMDRGNYRGLKMTDQVMKTLEHVLESYVHVMLDINGMQFGFMRCQEEALLMLSSYPVRCRRSTSPTRNLCTLPL